MSNFEDFKQKSYNLISEFIANNPPEVATPSVLVVIDKLLEIKDSELNQLATDKAIKALDAIADQVEQSNN